MKYLLDTNACIRYLNGRAPLLVQKLATIPRNEIGVSTITMAELFYGSAKSQTPERSRERQNAFLQQFHALVFDESCASTYGVIRATLEKQGTPISHPDMQIAATAIVYNLTLITHNMREFTRINGLSLEDWEV